jgi:RNA polymerase sigma-70 factor (ECF subfamily)
MEYQEVLAALRSALQSLPPRQRQAYRLARICGFTYEEVAQIMGISMKTVESHLHRTYKAIRARCAAHRPH